MGGNIFKDKFKVVRLDSDEYERLCHEFDKKLSDLFQYNSYCVIPSYLLKKDFGDLDIVHTNRFLTREFLELAGIDPAKISQNSNVISFLWNPLGFGDFQIDLIYSDSEDYESTVSYYSFNDMSNLRGRIAHMLGLKLGIKGLQYIHNVGDRVHFELDLCKDMAKIDEFLGFHPSMCEDIYLYGPETLDDIFDFISSSKYFNPEIFLLENRNHRSRVRDKKRKTYTEFLEYCEKLPKKEWFPKPEDKTVWVKKALEFFGKEKEYQDNLINVEKNVKIKSLFNGDIVSQVTGLEGKELGSFMKELKEKLNPLGVENLSPETIRMIIGDLHEVRNI